MFNLDEVLLQSMDWLESFPWHQEAAVTTDRDQYQYRLFLKDFEPKDISLNIKDGFIIVNAKHEEKKDEYGYISRSFKRRYRLPEGSISEKIESKLSAEGMLTITVPMKSVMKKDVVIPVSHDKKVKSKL